MLPRILKLQGDPSLDHHGPQYCPGTSFLCSIIFLRLAMSTNTRYSMRIQTRGNASVGNGNSAQGGRSMVSVFREDRRSELCFYCCHCCLWIMNATHHLPMLHASSKQIECTSSAIFQCVLIERFARPPSSVPSSMQSFSFFCEGFARTTPVLVMMVGMESSWVILFFMPASFATALPELRW